MISWLKQNSAIVAVLLGATVVMYGFYRGSMRLMHFFFNVSDKQIFNLGFLAGIFSAIIIAGGGFAARRYLTFHVDDVYRAALRELRKHESVETALGGAWLPGSFRGYATESLKEAFQGSARRERTSFWEAPSRRIQMIFQLKGTVNDGIVSLEAFKRRGAYHFEMLALDVHGTSEHLLVKGATDRPLFPEVLEILQAAKAK